MAFHREKKRYNRPRESSGKLISDETTAKRTIKTQLEGNGINSDKFSVKHKEKTKSCIRNVQGPPMRNDSLETVLNPVVGC